MTTATAACKRTLAEHLDDVIGLYQANLVLWADHDEDFARQKAVADVLRDATGRFAD